jgi:hypothetical protein
VKRIFIMSSISAALMVGSLIASAQTPPPDPSAPATTAAEQNHADSNDTSKGKDLVGDSKPAAADSLKSPATVGQDKAAGNNLVGENKGQAQTSENGRPDFQTLDVKKRGYVTAEDVKSHAWLKDNFSKCDSNHDGHLTQPEYARCVQ